MDASSTVLLSSGNGMPVIGLGTWQLTNSTAEIVRRAIELGYRMVDTSGDYGTQPGVGKGIRDSDIDRNDLFVVTKVEETDESYQASRDNLADLGLSYVDLMLIHRPPTRGAGVELWKGLIQARNEGLARDIGVSNYSVDLISELIDETGEVPAVNQIEWSPFGHSMEMLEFCNDNEIVIQAYSPLTRTKELDESTLCEIAETYNKTPAQILIRWNIQLGTVPIPKANHLDHLVENINVFDFQISDTDMATLSSLNQQFSALRGLAYV